MMYSNLCLNSRETVPLNCVLFVPEDVAAEGWVPGELAHVVAGHQPPDVHQLHCLIVTNALHHLTQDLLRALYCLQVIKVLFIK